MSIPDDLGDTGLPKATGRVLLPLHVRWTDPPVTYDLTDPADGRRVYEQVLRDGTDEDIRRCIDPDRLLEEFDELVLPPHVRRAWAGCFRRHRSVELAC